MNVNRFANVVLLALAASVATPAAAQSYVSDAEPFMRAVADRDGNQVMSLLDTRPTLVNSRNAKGQTALNIVIARSDGTWLDFLLAKGADPNLPASNGDTPLITAARVGFVDAIEELIRRGAKVNQGNKLGETPLIIAVQQRELDAVKLLLSKGGNPDKADAAAGFSARDYAKRDTRNREILAAIEAAGKPKPAKSDDLDAFKLK